MNVTSNLDLISNFDVEKLKMNISETFHTKENKIIQVSCILQLY